MNSTHSNIAPQKKPTALADARAYIRLVGDEGLAYFDASDEESAAQAVLSRRRKPVQEQDFQQLTQRAEECKQALPEQGVRGVRMSHRATVASAILLTASFVVMAAWMVVALFSAADYPILFRESYRMTLTFLEVMFLTPWVMFPFFMLYHLMASWKGRVDGRAALRWAGTEPSTHGFGIPMMAPFNELQGSWGLMRGFCGAALYIAVIPVFFFGMWALSDGNLRSGLGAALLYLLPVIALRLLAGRRAAVYGRRQDLLHHMLYRPPVLHPDHELSPDHVEEVEEDIDMSWLDELAEQDLEWREDWDRDEESVRRDLPPGSPDSDWKTSFSEGAGASDHLVDPDRRER